MGQDQRVQNPGDTLNLLGVLVLAACLSPPWVRGSQLDEDVSGSERLQPGVRQLHNWDLNMKKGKNNQSCSKKPQAAVNTEFALLGAYVCTQARTL